ncbi:MAG: putative tellurite resistance protein B-like protein [Myxococcota bacterium]|jgi:uncharacterized tellurite resistance protein B-like protein
MLSLIRRFFGSTETSQPPTEHDAQIAVCALFVEMASIDGEFSRAETDQILSLLSQQPGLSAADAADLLELAQQEAQGSIDLWQFTRRINEFYSTEEKLDIAEMLWRIVYADGHLDDHEHYLMGRLTGLLNLEHAQVIERKLAARDS